MSALMRLNNRLVLQNIISQSLRCNRAIQTSPKSRETAAVSAAAAAKATPEPKKNWVSFGFDHKDEKADRSSLKSSFFFSVTLCLVWGSFVWAYLPDPQLGDWSQREAFLELRRREQAGLDLISPNYIDPSSMNLPSDEELGDTEIII